MRLPQNFDFGIFIAYFLPGTLAFYALGQVAPQIACLFQGLLIKDQMPGASMSILVAGLMVGIAVSSFRALVLEGVYKLAGLKFQSLNFAALADQNKFAAYSSAINATYRYYQFNANMGVSLGFFILARYVFAGKPISAEKSLFCIYLITFVILMWQAPLSLKSTYSTLTKILGTADPQSPTA